MKTANFIHTESGLDLIISFALSVADDPTAVESLTLLRTPKFEALLEEHERGVNVSLELEEKGLLKEVAFDGAVVRLTTSECIFEVDLTKVEKTDIKKMLNVLKRMNFDGRFEISGLK